MTFQEQLRALGACKEAKAWVGDRTAAQAWAACPVGPWMVWLADALGLWGEQRKNAHLRETDSAWSRWISASAPARAQCRRGEITYDESHLAVLPAWAEWKRACSETVRSLVSFDEIERALVERFGGDDA